MLITPDNDGNIGEDESEVSKNNTTEVKWESGMFSFGDFLSCENYHAVLKPTQRTITISEFHNCVLTAICDEGIFAASYSGLASMFIEIGSISLCRNYEISHKHIDSIISMCLNTASANRSESGNSIMQLTENILRIIDLDDYDKVWNIYEKYCDSKIVRNCYYLLCNAELKKLQEKDLLGEAVKAKCKSLLKEKLTSSVLSVKKLKENKSFKVSVSGDFSKLILAIRNHLYRTKLISEVTRLCFVQGLYIISDIIIRKKVNVDEIGAKLVISELENIKITAIASKSRGDR